MSSCFHCKNILTAFVFKMFFFFFKRVTFYKEHLKRELHVNLDVNRRVTPSPPLLSGMTIPT